MALDFSQYLSKTLDDVEAPKPLPVGHYYATIKSWKGAEADYKQGAGKQPIIILLFSITGATDDIDTDLLPEGGGAGRLVTRDYELADADNRGLYALKRLAAETLNIDIKGLDLCAQMGVNIMKDASRQLPTPEMLITPDLEGSLQDVITKFWNTNQSADDAAKAIAAALKNG